MKICIHATYSAPYLDALVQSIWARCFQVGLLYDDLPTYVKANGPSGLNCDWSRLASPLFLVCPASAFYYPNLSISDGAL